MEQFAVLARAPAGANVLTSPEPRDRTHPVRPPAAERSPSLPLAAHFRDLTCRIFLLRLGGGRLRAWIQVWQPGLRAIMPRYQLGNLTKGT